MVVTPPCGPVRGKLDQQERVRLFLGIPYACPPVNELRWQPPQPIPPWTGLREASQPGMPAPQNPNHLFDIRGPNGQEPEDEDCLYLNIYAPAKPCKPQLPVMVWIHGGAFYLGSGCQPLYDGRALAASGRAIVVTLNYRLGALGFLRLQDISDIPASGNEGILDQTCALRWVQENIAAFGGDPQNITLFGESAGAMSIATLLAATDANDQLLAGHLFHKVIVQSGNPGVFHSCEKASRLSRRFLDHLDNVCGQSKRLPHQPTTRELLRAQEQLLNDPDTERNWGHLPFKPVMDGDFLKRLPMEALQSGSSSRVAMIVGSNRDEWNLFSAARPESFRLDHLQVCQYLRPLIPEQLLSHLLEHYRLRAEMLVDNPWPIWARTWNLMLTDMVFTIPGLRLLQAHTGPKYHYHFAQPLNAHPLLGACHAAELGYVFGTHEDARLRHLYGGNTDAHCLSRRMREAWLSFAESGCPGDDWPGFEQGHSRIFGNDQVSTLDSYALNHLWQALDDHQLRCLL
ncbi:carboxylesterase/lipase family protein [Microbulbifer bruguierae]|uniref:carboxylesterase/lipase family protein n=1 Tax=Microbulbifer bruguierae TaxID=3029061 RepID=UPI0038994EF9